MEYGVAYGAIHKRFGNSTLTEHGFSERHTLNG